MKRKICLLGIIALFAISSMALFACQEGKQLATPLNVKISGTELTWDAVPHAKGYKVNIDGTDTLTTKTSHSLANLTATKVYKIRIKAYADGVKFLNSEYSESILTGRLFAPINLQIDGTELTWDVVDNATSYVIDINETTYPVDENTFSLADLEPDIYMIKVRAVCEDTKSSIADSAWSLSSVYITIPMDEFDDLQYTRIEGSTDYEVSQGTATSDKLLILPQYNGAPVTRIAEMGFTNYDNLKIIIIPDTITEIGASAFSGCTSLISIALPNSLTTIREGAFQLSGLKDVTIPKNVSLIEPLAFSLCSSLAEVNVNAENPYFTAIDNVVYSKDKTALMFYPQGRPGDSYTVLDGVKIIYYAAFSNCKLSTVILPDSLEEIRQQAFYRCELTSIDIPAGVEVIEAEAFARCQYLSGTVTIPKGVDIIWFYSFLDCPLLENVVLHNGVKQIGYGSFASCPSLKSITIPASVTEGVGSDAFTDSNELTIYIEATTDTSNWIDSWNGSARPVLWGCTLSADKSYVVSFTMSNTAISNFTNGITAPYRKGYTFDGWSTTAGGSTADYAAGTITAAPNGTTVYAIWTKD